MELIEQNLGQEAVKELLPMQPGDIPATSVDTTKLEQSTSFSPRVTIEEGIRQFCDWFKAYRHSLIQISFVHFSNSEFAIKTFPKPLKCPYACLLVLNSHSFSRDSDRKV